MKKISAACLLSCVALWGQSYPAGGQYPPQQGYGAPYPPPPTDIDGLVQRIALYPDPLLAQVLTASTFGNEIPDAANWDAEHSYLQGDALAQAAAQDQLPWDPSIYALLPFPSVLNMMAQDAGWTQALGNAVLTSRDAVMDAVQRERERALEYGYLQSNQYVRVVGNPGDIEILPAAPDVIYVPAYDPYVVFARPRPGFYAGGAIRFGDWENRDRYRHEYEHPMPRYTGPRVERHEYRGRERREEREHEGRRR